MQNKEVSRDQVCKTRLSSISPDRKVAVNSQTGVTGVSKIKAKRKCTSQEKVDNALSIFLIAPSYLPKPAEPSFLAPCQLP